MKPFRSVTGVVAPLDRVDVDTDQIIPKQFLKRIERTGYGDFLFYDWRFRDDGTPDPSFVLNNPAYEGAPVLVAGRNFGCGSSREHAAWALADYGVRVVIAPTFADIFRANCFQNGMLPVALSEPEVRRLLDRAAATPGYAITVDLENCLLTDDEGLEIPFEVEAFRRNCLLEGLDDIDLTLRHADDIERYEQERAGV